MSMKSYKLQTLPLPMDIETPKVLKKAISANRALAKLNGVAKIIPNSQILINSLVLREAKDSSEIENIITTHDELFRAGLDINTVTNATKEVEHYRQVLLKGYALVSEHKLLLKRDIIAIQQELEQNDAGVRRQAGTVLRNMATGEVVFEPPQEYAVIEKLLDNLENYINEPNDLDALVNMAVIHYQFESIHPFYDGNGRKGSYTVPLYLNNKLLGFIFYDASEVDYFSDLLISHLVDYSRLIESLIISEILPIKSLIGMINTTRELTQFRDEETGKHLTRMAHYVELIALEVADKYNISDEEIEYMWLYAPLHDIGKIAIPDEILTKPAKLTPQEYKIIQTHVDEGIKMLDMIVKNFDFQEIHHIDILRQIIGEHHERIDGSGYPKALKGDEISVVGKITAIADVFDAMSSHRIYSDAMDLDYVFDYLDTNKGTLFDEDCVNAFISKKEQLIDIYEKFHESKRF